MLNNDEQINFEEIDQKLVDHLKSLPIDYWDFKDSDTHEYTHGIHSYPAVMVCPISRNIIKILQKFVHIESLFDPFCGSGTVIVEGMLAGLKEIAGNDLNPLARLLTKVKTTRIVIRDLDFACNKLVKNIKNKYNNNLKFYKDVNNFVARDLHIDLAEMTTWGRYSKSYLGEYLKECDKEYNLVTFKNIGYWFKPSVILCLQLIKDEIESLENNDIKDFAYVAMSETIRFVSNRRNGEFKLFRMTKDEVSNFDPDTITKFADILYRNINKLKDTVKKLGSKKNKPTIKIFDNNAIDLKDVPDEQYDLVITSPPYGDSRTTVAYGEYSRLSLLWIYSGVIADKEIFSIDKNLMGGKRYDDLEELESATLIDTLHKIEGKNTKRSHEVHNFYYELNLALGEISKKIKTNAYEFWVVGNRTVKNIHLATDKIIAELAPHHNLKHIITIDRNIPNKTMPLLNSPSNVAGETTETMSNEHIVILRKIDSSNP